MQFSPRSVFLHFRSKCPPYSLSQKPSACFPPSEWETKFRTHRVQMENYSFVYFNL
jgi:hypothetical protein